MNLSKEVNELFSSRGIDAFVDQIVSGLRTSKYYIKLGPSERVSKIRSLEEDLMLRLKTNHLPNISISNGFVVLEVVHNTGIVDISLSQLLQQVDISKYNLPLLIGATMEGSPLQIDLTDSNSPHILIGGTTGSGKSVLLKTIVQSLICRYPTKDKGTTNFGAEFILIDPKGTELREFSELERTLAYCTSYEYACLALEQAIEVMETRYRLFPTYGVKTLTDLRRKVTESDNQYIVIIIDELADLLLQDQKKRMRMALTRLTQKSRAAGIHLVVATQNPKRDVIDGAIKANMPTKIALRTNSSIESRIIIDIEGAENLVGKGDMLVSSGGTIIRAQGASTNLKLVNR